MLVFGTARAQALSQDIILSPYKDKPLPNDTENILMLATTK